MKRILFATTILALLVARGMVERGTRAIPTISAGTRYEVETGRGLAELQPNPGRMTRADWWANGRALKEAGVTLVPGTDVGINFTDFGEELFIELEAVGNPDEQGIRTRGGDDGTRGRPLAGLPRSVRKVGRDPRAQRRFCTFCPLTGSPRSTGSPFAR